MVLTGCGETRVSSGGIDSSAGGPSSGNSLDLPILKENIRDDNYRNYYEIFVYSYCDSNGDKIGDLAGIASRLDYIRDLGYTGIWLTPIFKSASLHKYNASDYFAVDPSFGTMADLETLISECHKRDIKIILDLVLNHSSRDNEYYRKAVQAHRIKLAGQTVPSELKGYEDFYVFYDSEEEARAAKVGRYSKVSGENFYYECNFDDDMPEFNFDSETVWSEFEKIMTFYQTKGVDGFRLDAVKYFYYNSTAKSIEALNKIKAIATKNDPDNYIVGECWAAASVVNEYYQSDVDSYFWFPASVSSNSFIKSSLAVNGVFKGDYVKGLKSMMTNVGNKIAAPFLDNHDMSRVGTGNLNQTKFVYGLLSLLPGTTFTYYGDEIGISASVGSDANARTHMDWSADDQGETNDPYNGTATYNYAPVDAQLQDPNSILNYYKKANFLRNCFPSIARGSVSEIVEGPDTNPIVVMKRTFETETITIVINFSGQAAATYTTDLAPQAYLAAEASAQLLKNGNEYSIPAFGIAIFK